MKRYSHKYSIILDNIDLHQYKLRPVSAISYIQDSFARYTATKGFAAYDLFPKNLYWIVSEFNINFVADLPYWSEEIETQIWISEISKLKLYTDYQLLYKGEVFAKGNACWFVINTESKRPAKTDIFENKFEICSDLTLGEHKKFTLAETTEQISSITHTNNLSDIDFNNHVNNKSYINLAELTAPEEFQDTHMLRELNIKFNKETFLGDILKATTYKTSEQNYFVHKITKGETDVCDITTRWENKKSDINTNILEYDLSVKTEK